MGQRKIDIQDISQNDGLNHVHQRVHKRHFQCVPFRGSVSHGMKEKSREKIKEKGTPSNSDPKIGERFVGLKEPLKVDNFVRIRSLSFHMEPPIPAIPMAVIPRSGTCIFLPGQ